MPSRPFSVCVEAETAIEAFQIATQKARLFYGITGFTGTIAEKKRVVVITPPHSMTDADKKDWVKALLNKSSGDPSLDWVTDAWSPAAAVQLDAGGWILFGWALSY